MDLNVFRTIITKYCIISNATSQLYIFNILRMKRAVVILLVAPVYNSGLIFHDPLKVLGNLACAKLQRERINCRPTPVYLFLYGESTVKIPTQTDSY